MTDSDRDAPEFCVSSAPDFSLTLATVLDGLTEALDGSGDDLRTILGVLVDDLRAGISSFVGLSITVSAGEEQVTVTAMNSLTAAASMRLPLNVADADVGHVVFYAHTPGAFSDLAADARVGMGSGGVVVVDGHLPPPTPFAAQSCLDDLGDRSTIDQAVGFLVGQGVPSEQAETELGLRAIAAGTSVARVAHQILQSDHRPDPDAGTTW